MMRVMMMVMVMGAAAPAFAGESSHGQASEKYEIIEVRPRSAYVVGFTENMKKRQRNRSSKLQALKAQRLTAVSVKRESALLARTIQLPVVTEGSVASK